MANNPYSLIAQLIFKINFLHKTDKFMFRKTIEVNKNYHKNQTII